ncbi:unnamed protein product [Periconia digitata]|uniref:protein disulfide-isomerase n=1 Tax=Periconia digitata TaxID=1303443 RepID=A0A9W4U614_9PLEO|nr:unnamed protein product [Periconia digitata]
MVRSTTLVAAAAALSLHAHAESLYSKKSAVVQITGPEYDRVIAKSNYTSILEFYAPWCGHCKNLQPQYEKAAKSLAGIAKVAAVNCDEEINKPFCGKMGVQGFPTLKIIRPGKKPGKPTVEEYQGQRQAKAIVDIVKDKIPNIVKRITDPKLDDWLEENKESAKAILFSDKGLVSATLRTLAIDFAGIVNVAQIRKTEAAAVEKYGITAFPSLILIPAGSSEPIKYDGEINKESMVKFLSQIAPPNPDCPAPKAKKPKAKKDDKSKESKASSKFSKASASHKSDEASSAATSAAHETLEEATKPTESPTPEDFVEDTKISEEIETKPSLLSLVESSDLQASCLNEKSTTCILALLPKDETSEAATKAVASLASIHKKHDVRQTNLFPFFSVPATNPLSATIITELSLDNAEQVHLIAVHGKRAWYKKYTGKAFDATSVEQWVDGIRMGEGTKERLPESLLGSTKKEDTPEHGEL